MVQTTDSLHGFSLIHIGNRDANQAIWLLTFSMPDSVCASRKQNQCLVLTWGQECSSHKQVIQGWNIALVIVRYAICA